MINEYLDMVEHINKQLDKYQNVEGLMRYFNENSLYNLHKKMDGKKATGIDNITKFDYGMFAEDKIYDLIQRMKTKKYKPKAVRRVMIPKPNGKQRPLGIPSYEDKLVQAKVAQILNVICERYFKDFSYGFRPNRDCHQAIKRIDEIIMRGNIKTIVEADIKGFFDHVDHDLLIRMLEVIIKDRDFIWLIKRFLKAGYMYQGKYNETDEGTPQGGLISPVLANLYLHVVLDNWFDNEVKTLCQGNAYIVRYADDFVCMFQNDKDAEMFYRMLIKRFDQFKLEVEPTKTKIFSFGRNSKENNTFDFLGFTITNGKTRQGYYRVDYNTSAKKSKLKFKGISDFIKQNIQLGYKELIKQLNRKLIGLYNYYGISGNFCWINKLYNFVKNILRKALGKRSQRGEISWSKLKNILEYNPLIKPEIKYRIW